MNWTSPSALIAQLHKLWERGELLAGMVSGESLFPRRLVLKSPSSTELSEHFDAARAWIAAINALPHCRIEQREFRHRVFGNNRVPDAVWIDSLDDALALLDKRRDARRFAALLDRTRLRQPALLPWLAGRPLQALALHDDWVRLLDLVDWMQAHPRPGLYLRQVDIAGVHSKFIEAHRAVLSAMFELALPAQAIDLSATGVGGFAQRFGFRDKPQRVRFRLQDPAGLDTDMTLDAASFARLDPAVTQVFITENEINFLAFPLPADSLVVFGAGYGFDMLRDVGWLTRRRLIYWGDIDTHGFAILDQLRSQFPQVASLMMDHATLLAFTAQWGQEDQATLRELPRLHADERALYDLLRDNRLGKNVRLEQERIGFDWVRSALAALSGK
ncbi:hypothetical protein IMCC9480_920 [Oxalobacteraceae bacterium IMCC9480]|nr:hypothetical protein IMCC9480_920 [Oxalobacteraceae bacterium IMCC9480]NDP57901.1 hypothetical protein [Oxalobacteraceae bacterium]